MNLYTVLSDPFVDDEHNQEEVDRSTRFLVTPYSAKVEEIMITLFGPTSWNSTHKSFFPNYHTNVDKKISCYNKNIPLDIKLRRFRKYKMLTWEQIQPLYLELINKTENTLDKALNKIPPKNFNDLLERQNQIQGIKNRIRTIRSMWNELSFLTKLISLSYKKHVKKQMKLNKKMLKSSMIDDFTAVRLVPSAQ